MNLNSKKSLITRLRRGKEVRQQFIESHFAKALASQVRATRDKLGWSQEKLARESNMNQNAISRLESLNYGKPTLTTLKRLAAAMDVGLIVRFVPFSEMVDWVSGTPRTIEGLSTGALAVSCFDREENEGAFEESAHTPVYQDGHRLVESSENQAAAGVRDLRSSANTPDWSRIVTLADLGKSPSTGLPEVWHSSNHGMRTNSLLVR